MRIDVDKRIVSKWEPIVDTFFKYKNRYIIEVICQFCEWYSKNDGLYESTLPDRLSKLIDKISNSSKRENIVGETYNPITGLVELKLESGKYVRKDSPYFELSIDELIELFGIDFVRFLNPQELRDNQIDKLWQS